MSATVVFTLSFFALLIIFSVVFDFWGYLVVIALLIFAGMIAWHLRNEREPHLIRMRDDPSFFVTRERFTDTSNERKLRNKIEDEWDRQSRFGSPEDLR